MSVIDTHLHLWDLGRRTDDPGAYPWLGPQHGDLFRDHLPAEARQVLDQAGVDRAVLVQAEDSLAETDLMLDWAERHDWIAGVVGWLPLRDPDATRAALARYHSRPLVGVRHLVHDDPDAGFLDEVDDALRLVAAAGLPLDVPDAWPRHLAQLTRVAERHPDLTVVVDHLAKPPRAGAPDELDAWAEALAGAAARPNVVAKVSGLQCPTTTLQSAPLTTEALRPVLDLALDLFGADRLLYGGDWPMTTLDAGGYLPHWRAIRGWIDTLPPTEAEAILAGTARRVYSLGADLP
ncbi:amidohydrolase family protein [Aestuariimicrobium soli]|uniref:amidohydrolase family protein n=1 Tax=Aestuariimicrobium soli TaxID=2035834 RepID=UPI003EB84D98